MAIDPLNPDDKAKLALADVGAIRNSLSQLRGLTAPPWLRSTNAYQNGTLPRGSAAFAAVAPDDIIELIAVRGPLHVIDGWSYLARALNSLVSGDPHASRHLAYYGELRAALSILASSGIGIFNKRNAVVDAAGGIHIMSERHTHDMCWASISAWALLPKSLDSLVGPLRLSGISLLDPFQEFFPSGASIAAGHLMTEWGFDLAQGGADRDERNWSSYQPTALADISTSPIDDATFLRVFWDALRPNGTMLSRQLLRILLETEARAHSDQLSSYQLSYERLDDSLKSFVPLDFLTRVTDPVDDNFLVYASQKALPAHPYSMICRAALLLHLATGMAERNLSAAALQPAIDFEGWWRAFGISHGLWPTNLEPGSTSELWGDVDAALDDAASAPMADRHSWISTLAGSATRICETERAALWGLFQ